MYAILVNTHSLGYLGSEPQSKSLQIAVNATKAVSVPIPKSSRKITVGNATMLHYLHHVNLPYCVCLMQR